MAASAQSTLREWYEGTFLLLFHCDARPGTIHEYKCTLSRWEALTKNPRLCDVDQLCLAEFAAAVGGSPATVGKHLRHLNHLFAKAGPPGTRNRDALGLLNVSPWRRPPAREEPLVRVPSSDEISQFVRRAPEDLALFAVLACSTGSRQSAIRSLEVEAVDLANGVVRFPASTDKRRRERLKPLPSVAVQWWKERPSLHHWRVLATTFNRRWKRHAIKAGVPTLRPHGCKRWLARELVSLGATPWAIRYALDHAQTDVTGMHYLAPFDELAGLIDRVPYPSAFVERLDEITAQRTRVSVELGLVPESASEPGSA